MSLDIQFSDVLPLWEHALAEQGGTLALDSEREAIHILHRLNIARKRMRDRDGLSPFDLYTVSRKGSVLTIKLREQVDLTKFKPLSGEALELEVE